MTGLLPLTRRAALSAAFGGLLRALPLNEIKLGITTDEIDEDPKTAADFLARFNLHWAEVRSVWGKYNTSQPVEKIREMRGIFDAAKVQTSIVDTAFFRSDIPTGAALDKEWALLDAAMDRGDILGTKLLRIFAFVPKDGSTGDTAAYPRSYELLKEAATRAKKRGFRLAVENLKGGYVQTGADSARLLKAVPNDNLGLAWDPNNAASCGEAPLKDGYPKLDPARIFHVHLRDWRHKADGSVEWAAVGTGEFDNVNQIRALRKDHYQGSYTLETHWRTPEGKARATEISLGGLLKVIAQV
ncbi:MAG: sugar phosphate isomerase/epimerase [Acidobacteria bacterium]|nr:sugar phosphate isomerase/epimerase [Acidobacteriota bacterium]